MFHLDDLTPFTSLLTDLYNLASSSDYIRDMRINEKLGSLLTLLMEQSWHPESITISRKRLELAAVKEYLDEHFTEKIMLEECPICRGAGLLMHEGGWNVQVECADCSAHTVYVEYEDEDEKADAERKVIHLWNIGKVITSERGE